MGGGYYQAPGGWKNVEKLIRGDVYLAPKSTCQANSSIASATAISIFIIGTIMILSLWSVHHSRTFPRIFQSVELVQDLG